MSQNNETPETTATTAAPRRKRKGLFIGAGATAALLLAGGVAYGIAGDTGDNGDSVRSVAAENRTDSGAPQDPRDLSDAASFRDAAEQAVAEAGGHGASSIDLEGNGHEVDVELDDGGSADVHVATDGAMRIETEEADRSGDEDPALDLAALEDIMEAALAASGDAGVRDGYVESVSSSDDRGVTYDVSVRGQDGREVEVDLADDFSVTATELDD